MGVKGWTVVWRGERIHGDLIAAVLEADGLRVEVLGDHAYGVGVNLTDARVMVPDELAETARNLIRQAEQEPDFSARGEGGPPRSGTPDGAPEV